MKERAPLAITPQPDASICLKDVGWVCMQMVLQSRHTGNVARYFPATFNSYGRGFDEKDGPCFPVKYCQMIRHSVYLESTQAYT